MSPPGVKAGGEQGWTLRGRGLDGVNEVAVDGAGVAVVVLGANGRTVNAVARAETNAAPGVRTVRVAGPNGLSNVKLIRVDHLGQTPEREPNDTPDQATPVVPGTAGVGELRDRDVDDFLVTGKAGERVTVEVEARRLGSSVSPVVTIMTADGRALFQAREAPGAGGDCRFPFTFPRDGRFVVQVRDNLYGGGAGQWYRIRVTDEPYATGLFPLGGPPGRPLFVTASGGTLDHGVSQVIGLPDRPGTTVLPPPFTVGAWLVPSPGRVIVGDAPEVTEPVGRDQTLAIGVTVNGRIDRPGEVDRYRFRVREGETLRIKVVAAALGSWLDSVVTVRDGSGAVLAEDDDAPDSNPDPTQRPFWTGDGPSTDSRVEFRSEESKDVFVEVTDRFGRGGTEFPYRLVTGDERPDFSILLTPPRAGAGSEDAVRDGAFHFRPGASIGVPFTVHLEGRPGPVEVHAVGLPRGVSARAVVIRPPPRVAGSTPPARATGIVGSLTLTVAPDAPPASGELWFLAAATPDVGPRLEREAALAITSEVGAGDVPSRRVVTWLTRFPYRVLGAAGAGSCGP